MKKYPEYKDSGVEWIGVIPQQWNILRLKYLSDCNTSNVDKLKKEEEIEILLCNYTDVYKNEWINSAIEFMLASATASEIQKFQLNKDDVLITKDSETPDDIAIPAYVSEQLESVLCGYHLAIIRTKKSLLNGFYLYYLFKSFRFNQQFTIAANGITRFGLSIDDVRNAFISLPVLSEQLQIAAFLDHKTRQIDDLIAKKQRLIELLREERTALINQAVTKGLDPTVPMKDSGIEWLGEIPRHWKRRKLKRLVKIKITDGPHETPEFCETGVPFLSAEGIRGNKVDLNFVRGYISQEQYEVYRKKSEIEFNDILLCKSGSTTGKSAIVDIYESFAIWSPLAIIRADNNLTLPKFLFHYMQSSSFLRQIENFWSFGTQPNISMYSIENLWIPNPPIDEQQKINEYLNNSLNFISSTIDGLENEISLINEYKISLINEAVTGKIDVRDYPLNHA